MNPQDHDGRVDSPFFEVAESAGVVDDDLGAYDPEAFFDDRRRSAEIEATVAEFRGMGLGPRPARSHVANQQAGAW